MTPTGGGQTSRWAKAGELLLRKQNHAGAIVRLTSLKTGIIYEAGHICLYRFARRGKDRRPEWHLIARADMAGKLSFRSKRAERNYGALMPEVDPADIDLMMQSFREHVTHTREYRRAAKEKELIYRGEACSRGAVWVMARKHVDQPQCLFFPGAVCYAPAKVTYNYQSISAARAMCIEAYGQPGRQSDVVRHKCAMGHMSCVNPSHLSWGSRADNDRDRSLHSNSFYDPSDYPPGAIEAAKSDARLTKVIAWELRIPAALVSAVKLADM